MINEPIYRGLLQSDLDCAGYSLLNSGGGGGGGSEFPSRINIKQPPYNAHGDGVTDDTAAIQLAIDNLTASGGGTIVFPDEGPYIIAGPLRDTSRRNSQLLLPVIPVEDARQFSIAFEGYCPIGVCTGSMYRIPMPNGTRLKSTLPFGTGTEPSVICGKGPVGGAYGETTNIHVEFRNMIFETVPNPSYSCLNLRNIMDVATQDILVVAGGYFDTMRMTEPMNATSYGIIMPDTTRGEFMHMRGQTNVFGFYNGIGWAELCIADMISVLACKVGVVVPDANHPSIILRFLHWFCTRGMVVTGNHRLTVLQWDAERGYPAGSWYITVSELDDPSNFLVGETSHFIYDNVTGSQAATMNVTGALNFNQRQIGQKVIYIGSDARFSPIAGGVKLEVRNVSTGTWVEATRYTNP